MGDKYTRRQLRKLYTRQRYKCHWCGIKMLPPGNGEHGRHAPMNPRLCTLDHLDDRWSKERGKHPNGFRRVAACWKCNNGRGAQSEASQPIEVLRAKAGAYPIPKDWWAVAQIADVSRMLWGTKRVRHGG